MGPTWDTSEQTLLVQPHTHTHTHTDGEDVVVQTHTSEKCVKDHTAVTPLTHTHTHTLSLPQDAGHV